MDEVQGAGEERSESYKSYEERVPQPATQQFAKSADRVSGSARKQVGAVRRVGIFAGTFDPVHEGHIAFALSAANVAGLDKIVFLTETSPRGKNTAAPIKHRQQMLILATKPFKNLEVLELDDKQFTVAETLPKIQKKFPRAQLYLLVGSDILKTINKWPNAKELLKKVKIISGQRETTKHRPQKTKDIVIYTNFADLSSSEIRKQLAKNQTHHGISPEIASYISKQALYAADASVSEP